MSEKDVKSDSKIKPQTTSIISGNQQGTSLKTTIPEAYVKLLEIGVGDEIRHHPGIYKGRKADIITKVED